MFIVGCEVGGVDIEDRVVKHNKLGLLKLVIIMYFVVIVTTYNPDLCDSYH